jgi:4-hydroxybenzoate polyprenyltransferase
MGERFPPPHAAGALLVCAAAIAWGRALSTTGALPVHGRDALAALAAVAFFLMLRVFDEHKDYAADCVAHPERVLQRGVITLRHLKLVGAAAIAVQFAVSLLYDRGIGVVTSAWLVALVWSLLMAREFFIGAWLRPRLALYALSHMIAMPLAVHWMLRMGADGAALPAWGWALPAVSYLTGSAFEIGRKLKAPEDERPDVDSYTRVFGTARAPMVLAAVLTLAAAGFAAMIRVVAGGPATLAAGALLSGSVALAWSASLRFGRAPSAGSARACETAAALVVAAGHLLLVLAIAIARGVTLG